MVDETQRELQNKFIDIFDKCDYVHGYIKKSKSIGKLNDKSINANDVYGSSQIGKFFIDNPKDCLAMVIPDSMVVTDLDYPEVAFLNKDEEYEIIKSKYEGLVQYMIDEKKKVVITKTNKGYHIYSKKPDTTNKYTNQKSNSGSLTYSLLDQVDYKFGTEKGSTFVYAPIYTEHSTNAVVQERTIVYIGVDSMEELEHQPIVLQSPKVKVTLKDKILAWRNYVDGGNLSRVNKTMREGSRETTLYEYANRLVDFGLSPDELLECLCFVNWYILGSPLSKDEILNIQSQMIRETDIASSDNKEGNITLELISIAMDNKYGSVPSVKLEKKMIEYLEKVWNDTIILNNEILIKEDNSYNYHDINELKFIITTRVEEATSPGMATKQLVRMIEDAILRRNVITRYEYEKLKTPDNIVVFKNGYFDFDSEMFSSEQRVGEINLKVLNTRYNPNPSSEMTKAVKDYLLGLANGDMNTYKNIRDMLGTILIKKTKDHKSFFILYGSKDGNNGKSTFFDLLHDVIGQSQISTTSIDQMTAKFGLAPLENSILTTCGEIGEEVKSGYEILKAATGGDLLPLEKKGKDQYMGTLTTTLIFASNHKTQFTNAQGDNALNKRVKFVDFHNEFNNTDIDHDFDVRLLKDKAFQEAFLFEMVACSLDLKSRNFNFHPYANQNPGQLMHKIKATTTKRDLVATFVEKELSGSNAEGIKKKAMWAIFRDFAERTPCTAVPTQTELFIELWNEHEIAMAHIDKVQNGVRHRGQYSVRSGTDVPETFVENLQEFQLRQARSMREKVTSSEMTYETEDLL